ncbi:uncharacterized protein BYT42DRAFT_333627 [Radiomyces spectabilis]|uniref:uncharacterized protein n=1 Tax=Radiomyces spectabilis TaxID=64574 RepID=UPI00221F698E|nr:uncharacterized protein BYT42DRAFT_333627 [Radiomyces spectabilis]KAI8379620.1 hypothetical protein BYT42DRAFT_333627 [Radiomyces spectabilis]
MIGKANDTHSQDEASEEKLPRNYDTLQPLLTALHHLTLPNSTHENKGSFLLQLLELPYNDMKYVCENVDFQLWPADLLADLCSAIQASKDVTHPCMTILIHKAVYPHILSLDSSLSRVMMNPLLSIGQSMGKPVLDGLILPLLRHETIGRIQLDVANKLVTHSLSPSIRLLLLRALATNEFNGPLPEKSIALDVWNDDIAQIINNVLSTPPLLDLDSTLLLMVIHKLERMVDKDPKNKSGMQVLLVLTSKYGQTVAETGCIEAAEMVATKSTMFLKRSILGKLTGLRKKLQLFHVQ